MCRASMTEAQHTKDDERNFLTQPVEPWSCPDADPSDNNKEDYWSDEILKDYVDDKQTHAVLKRRPDPQLDLTQNY